MRKVFYSLVVMVAMMTSAIQMKAAHFVPVDGGVYHFVFVRGAGNVVRNNLSVSERTSDGVLVSADLNWNDPAQKWTVSKNGDDYTFTNGNGKIMYFANGRFKTGVAGSFTAGQELMNLRHSTANAPIGTDSWVIAPKGNNQSMNPLGGSLPGKEFGLWHDNDGGNAVKIANPKILLDLEIPNYEGTATNLPVGDDFGQYKQADIDAYTTALNTVKGISDADHYAQAYIDAIETLKQAKATLLGAINKNLNTLLSKDATKYRWYAIKSTSSHAYATNKVITSKDATDKFKFEDQNNSDEQLFRFEVVGNKVVIINKANEKYLGQSGAVSDAGVEFALNVLDDAYSFNIKQDGQKPLHAQEYGSEIVSWIGGKGTSSAWVFDFVKETPKEVTSVNDVKGTNFDVVVANGRINVVGVDNFSVFTVAGQRVSANQTLQSGVYVVKVDNFVQKVVVK